MYRFLHLIFLLVYNVVAVAQQQKLVFNHYGLQQGFNSRVCRTVVKTADGMVWISSEKGLVRYDSKQFKFYQHNAADSNTISSNFTDQMVADKKGKLWIVAGKGLDIFDPQTEKFLHCYLVDAGKKKNDFRPESLHYDSVNNRIWAGTALGLFFCEAGKNEFVKAKAAAATDKLLQQVFGDIKQSSNNSLWLCAPEGLYRYDIKTGSTKTIELKSKEEKKATGNGGFFCLYPEGDSIIWIGTWVKGLIRYNVKKSTGTHYYYSNNLKEQNGVIFITQSGLQSEKDILWLSTPNMGLVSFNKKTGVFGFYFSEMEHDKNGIKAITNRMLTTKTEGMWIASENGLHRLDYSRQLFNNINLGKSNSIFKKAFPPEYLCFLPGKNRDSICWFHIPYLGTYRYDLATGKLQEAATPLKEYLSGPVYAAFTDAAGTYWAGTDDYGLVGYDLKGGVLKLPVKKYFINDREWVTGFFEDAQQRLWLATYKGLFVIDKNRASITNVDAVNRELERNGLSVYINGIDEDAEGRIWATAVSSNWAKNAIVMYEPATNKTALYYEKKNKQQGFPADVVLGNIACGKNSVYAATNSGLLMLSYKNQSPEILLLTDKNGLISNNIEQVLADNQFNIWCSTDFGASCYLPARNFFINYTHSISGIGPQKVPAMYKSSHTGLIYFSQQAGIDYLNPENISEEAVPAIYFTGIQLFNKPFLYNSKQPQAGDVIRLAYNENTISVEFTGMSFSSPDDNRFAHMLEGLEKDWNVSKNNIASYTNLAPGTYHLMVKTSNGSGLWTNKPAIITFIISPPFWKTWWFITLMVLAVAATLYALYRYRIKQLLGIQAMQNTISRNLHDEIGSTLTSINILSNVSQQAMEKEPEQAKEMLRKISVQSKSIQQNMSDIVWAIRSDNDKIENLLVRMREYAAQTLEPLNILTTISINETLLQKALGLQARKELLLIYKEAVNNIAKHAGASEATITLQQTNNMLELTIKDNGKWKGSGINSGTGLGSMQQRAAAIGGQCKINVMENGTELNIVLPVT